MRRLFTRLRSEEDGSVLIIVAAMITALMGLAAIVADVGRVAVVRQRLVAIADAASLSGGQYLPTDPSTAVDTARTYLYRNGVDLSRATVGISDDRRRVTITLDRDVEMTFARVLGQNRKKVAGGAVAESENLSGYYGAVPLGVPQAAWTLGEEVILKLDGGDGTTGNYGALALGGRGASNYEGNLESGYSDWIRSGEWLKTETGNMSGPTDRAIRYRLSLDPAATYTNYTRNSPRLLLLPILPTLMPNGRGEVQVIGFAVFFVEGSDHGQVKGRFVKYVAEGEGSLTAPDFGVYTTKLKS